MLNFDHSERHSQQFSDSSGEPSVIAACNGDDRTHGTLYQPMQSLLAVKGLLTKTVDGTSERERAACIAESLTIVSVMILSMSIIDGDQVVRRDAAVKHLAGLTKRQHEVMDMVLAGSPSKNIAADLGISQRTVENHRASIMRKTGSKSLPELARLAVVAA